MVRRQKDKDKGKDILIKSVEQPVKRAEMAFWETAKVRQFNFIP